MNIQQIAKQAMDYLDSVGVAADWDIKEAKTPQFEKHMNIDFRFVGFYKYSVLNVFTDTTEFYLSSTGKKESFINETVFTYPQKSPD